MAGLVLRALLELVYFDLLLARGDFARFCDQVRSYQVKGSARSSSTAQEVCAAIDLACIWYWKEVRCLQRSAATACLLRRNGVPARMVIGAQQIPFKAHAWVELDGSVINDRPYVEEIYSVLDSI